MLVGAAKRQIILLMRRVKKVILFVLHAQAQSSARNDANAKAMPKICGRPMMNELEVSELRFLVRSSATIGDDMLGRGMRENMRVIRKRDTRLRSIDAMGDRWIREQKNVE